MLPLRGLVKILLLLHVKSYSMDLSGLQNPKLQKLNDEFDDLFRDLHGVKEDLYRELNAIQGKLPHIPPPCSPTWLSFMCLTVCCSATVISEPS